MRFHLLQRVEGHTDHDQDARTAERQRRHLEERQGMMSGRTAIAARNTAPGSVMRVSTRSMYSAVLRPGRMPGMKPPYFRMFSARSFGFNNDRGGRSR